MWWRYIERKVLRDCRVSASPRADDDGATADKTRKRDMEALNQQAKAARRRRGLYQPTQLTIHGAAERKRKRDAAAAAAAAEAQQQDDDDDAPRAARPRANPPENTQPLQLPTQNETPPHTAPQNYGEFDVG